jgi:hypothetical protein
MTEMCYHVSYRKVIGGRSSDCKEGDIGMAKRGRASSPEGPGWEIRVEGEGVAPAGQFLANPANWRKHPIGQTLALKGSLDEVGWVRRVLVNKRSSSKWGPDQGVETLLDGHDRVELALQQGEDTPVPYEYVDLDPGEEAFVLATLDPIGAMARSDSQKLDELLRQVKTESIPIQEMLAKVAEEAGLYSGKVRGEEGEYDISPELHERQDYLVLYFDNEFDWQVACQALEVRTVECPPVGSKTVKQRGLGRVVSGRKFLQVAGLSAVGEAPISTYEVPE